jgi:phage shock protein A
MGILDRISMIVRSNVNDVLDKAENPERQLNYFIYEMADSIKEAENAVTEALTSAKMLQLQGEEARRKAQDWEQKAERALKANREDLAREALRMKGLADEEATNYQTQYETQKQMQQQLSAQLANLKVKYEEVQRNKNNLLARYGMAKATNKVFGEKDLGTGLNTGDLSRMERKIMASEVANELDTTLKAAQTEAEINNLSETDTLDDELSALKAKMGLGKKAEEKKEEGQSS